MKGYIKRLARWIIKGIPEKHITVTAGQLSYGHAMEGKSVLITGGNSGIGFATAKKCISEGARVLIIGRNEEKNKTACQELGTMCDYLTYDLRKMENISAMMEEAYQKLGKIDGLVLNAGISGKGTSSIYDVSDEMWEKTMQINLKSPYFTLKEYLRRKKDGEEGSVVFTASDAIYLSAGGDIPYWITKGAIGSITMGISTRLCKKGIRCNAVAPSVTATPMVFELGYSETNMYNPVKKPERNMIPEEVAEVIFFLLSDASKCISGLVIPTDGGDFHR